MASNIYLLYITYFHTDLDEFLGTLWAFRSRRRSITCPFQSINVVSFNFVLTFRLQTSHPNYLGHCLAVLFFIIITAMSPNIFAKLKLINFSSKWWNSWVQGGFYLPIKRRSARSTWCWLFTMSRASWSLLTAYIGRRSRACIFRSRKI